MNAKSFHHSSTAGLLAGSLAALALATPLTLKASAELSADANIIKLSVLGSDINDSEAAYQAAQQRSRYGLFGIEELRYRKALSDNTTLTADFKLLPGADTYDNVIRIVVADAGSAEVGYTQFRTFYDGIGGFFPTKGVWKAMSDRMLHVDRSKFWVGAKINLPDKPVVSLKFTSERRYGTKDSTIWGETNDLGSTISSSGTAPSRKISPGYIELDEQVQTFEAMAHHTVGKTKMDLGVVGTFVDNLNTRYFFRYPGEVRIYPAPTTPTTITWQQANNETSGYDMQGVDSQTWAFLGKFETELSEKVSIFGGVTYASTNVDYTGTRLASVRVNTVSGIQTVVGGYTGATGRPPYSYADMLGVADHRVLTANLGVNLKPVRGLYVTAALKAESVESDTANTLTYLGGQYTQTTGVVIPKSAALANWGRTDEDVWVPELSVRYNGIRGLSLYGTVDFRNSPGKESNYNQTVGQGFAVSSSTVSNDVDENHLNGKLGFRYAPVSWLNFGAEGLSKNHANSFTDATDPASRFVLDSEIKGGAVYATVIPVPELSFTTRYVYRDASMRTSVDNLAGYDSLDNKVHQISETASWSPSKGVYLQGSVTFVFDSASTAYPRAGGVANTLLQNADNDYWTAHAVAGFDVTEQTKVELQYATYKSSNYQPALALTSLPYGASQRDHELTLGVKHKFSESLAGEAKIGYLRSDNQTTGGYADYDGLLGYVSVTHAF